MGASVAMAVSGGLQAVGSIVTGILQYRQSQIARKDQKEINKIEDKASLAGQKSQEEQARRTHALNVRQQDFTEQEAEANRAERLEKQGYDRSMSAFQRATDILNKNQINLAARTAPLIKRA
jgi:hypothetical protein